MTGPIQPRFPVEYIDTAAGMDRLLQQMDKSSTVFLDLEADSMHHYFAKICLIQILVEEVCYLVDPLSGMDLSPFLSKLETKLLVLHGADYDLRMLFQLNGFRPYRIFDTMIAAQLLGKAGFGLAALVQAYFEISLPKDQQKADWSSRPLTASMLEYGAQDTFFLPSLCASLTQELADKNRLSWHEETCRELIKATAKIKEIDLENAWRIEGSARLHPRQLAALQSMWSFRDEVARNLDLPAYRILPSDVLLRFALAVPLSGDPETIPTLPSRLSPEHKKGFLDFYRNALELQPENWPKVLRPSKKVGPSPDINLVNHLKIVRDAIAKGLALDPSLLATKSTLANVALTGCTSRAKMSEAAKWMNWQEALLLDAWLKPKEPPTS